MCLKKMHLSFLLMRECENVRMRECKNARMQECKNGRIFCEWEVWRMNIATEAAQYAKLRPMNRVPKQEKGYLFSYFLIL